MEVHALDHKPWLRIAKDLKQDAPFFCTIGLIFGFVQFWGYTYFHGAEWGSDLLMEHIPFQSLLLMAITVGAAKSVTAWLSSHWRFQHLQRPIAHLTKRTIAFGSAAACVMIGFAVCTAIYGAFFYAAYFVLAGLYFAALAEVSANPFHCAEWSKANRLAVSLNIVTPVLFVLLPIIKKFFHL